MPGKTMTKDMRFLVPSAGAGSSVSVIKAIVQQGGFVLAVDISPAAAGLFLADQQAIVPRYSNTDYIPRILKLCAKARIKMVIPVSDTELGIFNRVEVRNQFDTAGVRLAMNPPSCVHNGTDKAASYLVIKAADLRQPHTFSTETNVYRTSRRFWRSLEFPLIVKPFLGVGGRGQLVAECLADVKRPPFMVDSGHPRHRCLWQKYIPGVEYSVDTWGDPDEELFVAVPRIRHEVRAGQMTQGQTVYCPEVSDFVRQICRAFGSKDVCCVQVIRSAEDGRLYFIEMNPRYGTGVSLSIAAGVNFPLLQWYQAFDPGCIYPDMLSYRANLKMTRHWEEIYWDDHGGQKTVLHCKG